MTECRQLSADEEFPKDGYSEQSLKMLDSAEGQLNAVYALYGSAASQGQFLEDAARRLLTKVSGGSLPPGIDEMTGLYELICALRKRITITDGRAWKSFDTARKVRNDLIHQYFRDKEHKLETKEGRMEMLTELVQIETPIRIAKELINGMRVAVDQAFKSGRKLDADELLKMTLSEEVGKSHLPPYCRARTR